MGTNPEITRHLPKKIELDENYFAPETGCLLIPARFRCA